ncbi:adenosylcobinamide-phosphate synthase CbiB [Niveispirillum sp. KHB5.9]|uniref:adenosylcobinamide-phosphate synthase CbiB n=1 Tax=Niveispirillum sp. KHB5.9 TaxID=3400269 RepID=UPI003A89E1EA
MEIFPPLLLCALIVEAVLGYPDPLYRAIRHPVTWIGAIISALDRRLNRGSVLVKRLGGIVTVLILVGGAIAIGGVVQALLLSLPYGWVILALLASTLLAQRSLYRFVKAVAVGLRDGGLAGGRSAVAHIVGRDPESLDEAGVARAAIESLAENFSDGITAPAFWLAVGGLPGLLAYKTINTADSMIGHRTPRHEAFGWAAARLDDLVNLPASRLTTLLLALASGPRMGAALAAVKRDAGKHRSPNAGWPEAAMAGALGLRLAGPRRYAGHVVDDHWMGDGRADVTAGDIEAALRLYIRALGLMWVLASVWALL